MNFQGQPQGIAPTTSSDVEAILYGCPNYPQQTEEWNNDLHKP